MIIVDRLKSLKSVATQLKIFCQSSGALFRYGGEELRIVFEVSSLLKSKRLLSWFREALKELG